jgi:hypothetical protein
MNNGRAWEAIVGENIIVTGDYAEGGVLKARHVWLGFGNLV